MGEGERPRGAQLLRRLSARACATTARPITAARPAPTMIDLLVKTKTETREPLLHKYPWPARSPNGTINTASVLDMQTWYVESKMTTAQPAARAAGRHRAMPVQAAAEARAVRGREQGQQASGLPLSSVRCRCAGHDRPAPRRRDRDRRACARNMSAAQGTRASRSTISTCASRPASSSASSGRSGCGKSTLLRILAGPRPPDGRHHHRRRRRAGRSRTRWCSRRAACSPG